MKEKKWISTIALLMSGSLHLSRALNLEIGVECQKIFVIVIFFNCGRVLQFGAHSKYYKGALTQKRFVLLSNLIFVSAEKIKTNIQHWLDSSFTALSKWHEPDITEKYPHMRKLPSRENYDTLCAVW